MCVYRIAATDSSTTPSPFGTIHCHDAVTFPGSKPVLGMRVRHSGPSISSLVPANRSTSFQLSLEYKQWKTSLLENAAKIHQWRDYVSPLPRD